MVQPASAKAARSSARRAAYRCRCSPGVRVVVERGRHRGLHRARHDHPGLLGDRQQVRDQRGVAGHEPGPVTGQVGPLGQRMNGQHAVPRRAAHVGVQHRDGRDFPAQRDVALVGRHHRPALPGPFHHLAQVPGGQHPPGGVGRRVHPDELDPAPGRPDQQAVRRHRRSPGEPRADVVGGVRQFGVDHHVARPEPEHDRKPRDELLGADNGQHVIRRHADTPCARASHPAAAARNCGVPHVAGYPGAFEASARASRIRSGTGSTGVPMDRSTGPSGWSPAFSRSGAIRSQVKAGSRPASVIPPRLAAAAPPPAGGPCRSCRSSRRRPGSRGLRRSRR